MPFKIQITDDQKTEYTKLVLNDITDDRTDRSAWDERRRRISNAYRNRVKKKVKPWPGCSNTSMPIIPRAADRMTIHIMQTVAPQGNFDGVMAVPVTDSPLAMDRAENISNYLNYYFRNRMRISDPLERFSRNFVLYGNGFGKMWWKRKFLNTRQIEMVPAFEFIPDPSGQPVRKQIPLKRSVQAFFANQELTERLTRKGKDRWQAVVYDPIEKREKVFVVSAMHDEGRRENHLMIESKELVINQPQFDNIDIDDIYFSQSGCDINDAKHVAIRYEKSFDEIVSGWRSGRWNQLTERDIEELEEAANIDDETGDAPLELMPRTNIDMGQEVKREQDASEGVNTSRTKPFECVEDFRRIDIDGDGEEEEVVVWVEARTQKIMRIAHVFEDYHTYDRPILHAPFIPVSNRILGIGVGEVLMPLLVEMNTLFNNRNDASSMMVAPGGFYRPQSGFEPQKFPWQPNTWLPVENPGQDVAPYVAAARVSESINVENMLMGLAEDLSISTFTFGGGSNRGNAPRTARGTLVAVQQDEIKLNYMLQRLMPTLEDICHKTLELLRINGPENEEFRVLGSSDVSKMDKDSLRERIDFVFDLDSVSANKEIRRQFSSAALEGALQLAMMPPESIPPGARILAKNFLKSMDVKEVDQIFPTPPGFERPPMDQEEEIHMMLQGIAVKPVMADNHEEHIGKMEVFQETDEFAMMPTEWVASIWKDHKQEHVRLLQIQQQQMQQQLAGITGSTGSQGNFANPQGGQQFDLGNLAGGSEIASEALGSTFSGG